MLRMIQSISAGHAKAYFSEALAKSDYYLNDQELRGVFAGRLADRLGLKGDAMKEAFFALCENRNPATGKPLTPRTKAERVTGYDISFHVPKSISILYALAKDDHILKAFEASVSETMADIEKDSKTRVRKEGVYEDRVTGELVWAQFIHQTARPVEGHAPDPHLHCHCFVFNATWDEQEKKIKAAKFRDIKRDMPYHQSRFHKRLADKMVALGYQVKRTNRSFEIEGVPQEIVEHFSKRTDQIGRVAKEMNITDAKELDALGARTRSKKQKGLTMTELKEEWKKQIKELSIKFESENNEIRFAKGLERKIISHKDCIDYALLHCFERASVVGERKILQTATEYAFGQQAIYLDDLTKEFKSDNRILHIAQGDKTLCTTKEVLTEEKRMVNLAQQGRNKLRPLCLDIPEMDLKPQQAAAVRDILTTTNRVSIVRGGAGTGKTRLMQTAVRLIEQTGKKVFPLAPTAQASRGVLKDEGFKNAETVAKFLADKNLQRELQDQVIWVDEAGLLGTKDTVKLLELAEKKNARLILGGDTRQHASVVRGDALRVLNTVAGIKTAEVSDIQRQKNFQYRSVVEDLSKAQIKSAFDKLDAMGAIKAVDPNNPNEELVRDYMHALKTGKTALVISPTHEQGDRVTEDIRKEMRDAKMIGKKQIAAIKYTNLNLTEAEKMDWRNFEKGQVVQFNQNTRKIKRGSLWTVKSCKNNQITIEDAGKTSLPLPIRKPKYFDVYQKSEIGFSKGDKVRITRNGFDKMDKRLDNGMTLDVLSATVKGRIILQNNSSKNKYVIDRNFGHIAHAHCITSHASQGKTVDEVFISQPSGTLNATDAKQFYVSVSRGRENVKIYTDDRKALLEHASEIGDRQSALELVNSQSPQEKHIIDKQRSAYTPPQRQQQEKVKTLDRPKTEKEYEPGL